MKFEAVYAWVGAYTLSICGNRVGDAVWFGIEGLLIHLKSIS